MTWSEKPAFSEGFSTAMKEWGRSGACIREVAGSNVSQSKKIDFCSGHGMEDISFGTAGGEIAGRDWEIETNV